MSSTIATAYEYTFVINIKNDNYGSNLDRILFFTPAEAKRQLQKQT